MTDVHVETIIPRQPVFDRRTFAFSGIQHWRPFILQLAVAKTPKPLMVTPEWQRGAQKGEPAMTIDEHG